MSSINKTPIFLTAVTILFIIFAIVIVAVLQGTPEKPFSKIVTVGPVWNKTVWSCTSNENFIVHGVMRGLQGAELTIRISDLGTQSLYAFEEGKMESFTVGSPADHTMEITRKGTISGWLTLQTVSGAKASCTQK